MSSNSDTPEDDSWFLEAHRASSIAIFCVIFIILTFYSIFQCFFYGNPRTSSSRNRDSTGDSNEPDHDDHHSIQIQGRGLELWAISSLPMSPFKKSEGEEEKGSNRECAICLGEFEEEEWVKRLPICAHVFHVSCITMWFRSHSNCPLCRSNVIDDHLARSLDSSASALLTTHR